MENEKKEYNHDLRDKIVDMMKRYTIMDEIVGDKVELKVSNPYNDDVFVIKVVRNDKYDFAMVKGNEFMMYMNFYLYPGVDDDIIKRFEELKKTDEKIAMKEMSANGKNYYSVLTGGFEELESIFPSLYTLKKG